VNTASKISGFIETLGIPMAVTLAFGLGGWWLIKYILTSIVTKISEAQKKTEENIRDLRTITISLIEKSQALQGDLIRLDTMLRVIHGLPPDEARIGRTRDPDRPERK
jgi:hypothetical protein